jgi:Caspase domain
MREKLVLNFLLAFIICLPANSQSIYRLKYKLPGANDIVTYDAFFVSYDNGSGFIRVNYRSPAGNSNTVVEMEIQQQYAADKDGVTDTTKFFYEGMDPKFIKGDPKIKFTPVTFWFKINPETNLYDPSGVSVAAGDKAVNFLSAEFLRSQDITKDMALLFFTEQDDFYINLLGPKSKGGMLTAEERKTRLFLLVVASTNDSSIGTSCLSDGRKSVQTFSDVADFLGIRKMIDTVYGDRYNKTTVVNEIAKINPAPNDIVIFYYSGHGFTDEKKKNKDFPFLDLRDPLIRPRADPTTQTLNIQDIYDIIDKKGARFNLVLSDCCNDAVEAINTTGIPPPRGKGSGVKWNFENVKALFMNQQRLSLLMTAASKGERASSNNNFGGFFSHFFLSSMTTYLGPDKGNPSWIQVMADAQKQTIFKANHTYCPLPSLPLNVCHQTPRLLLPSLN